MVFFTDLPKFMMTDSKNITINSKDPLPYYDPTIGAKLQQVNELKNQIVELKHKLGDSSDTLDLTALVRNSTFPFDVKEAMNNFIERFNLVDVVKKEVSINGGMKDFESLYALRGKHVIENSTIAEASRTFLFSEKRRPTNKKEEKKEEVKREQKLDKFEEKKEKTDKLVNHGID